MSYSQAASSFRQSYGLRLGIAAAMLCIGAAPLVAQTPPTVAPPAKPATQQSTSVDVPPEYVIGPQDVLGIVFWRDADMTGDVTVRPDGRITLPLIGDLTAAGVSPDALQALILKAATKVLKDPNVTVVIRQINSRKVFITGQVQTPGPHVLAGPLTVMQLISMAGGLNEYAKKKEITIIRTENGQPRVFQFNYNDVSKGKNLATNILLKPGDTVVVP